MVEPGDVYRHFKGTEYVIVSRAVHTETEEPLVLYTEIVDLDDPALLDLSLAWDRETLWARPEKMFLETVTRDGVTFPRFERVDA